MEYNIKKYQFNQNGTDYVVSTGLVYDHIRITCQENLNLDGPFYSNEFSLYELQNVHQFFKLTSTPEQALKEINKGIERQKCGLKLGANNIMHFFGYLVIGTDNDVYVLNLKRSFDENKYGVFTPPPTGAADLVLSTNYKVDGERLVRAEINAGNLQKEETMMEEELDRIIPQINKLKRISMDIEEENALIKERIRILQKKLEQKKYNVFRLKEENANLKRENQSLINSINEQENVIRNKQALQMRIQIKPRPNVNPQGSAVVSKFEQATLRTFLPRTGPKPNIENINTNQNYNYSYTETYQNNYYTPEYTTEISPYIATNNTYENISYQAPIQTQVLPTIYQPPQPLIINVPQQQIIKSPPILRFSYKTNQSNQSYNNTYKVYLKTPSENVVYKNKIINPKLNNSKNVAYTSVNNNINNEIKSNTGNNLVTLTDNIKSYNEKDNLRQLNPNSNLQENINSNTNTNNNYVKPTGSRMPKANLGNYSKSPSKTSNKRKDFPEIGYSNYNPDKK